MSFRTLAIVSTLLLFVVGGCDSEEEPPVDECDIELGTDVGTDQLALYLPLDGDLKDHSGNCRDAESTMDLSFADRKVGRAGNLMDCRTTS